MDELVFKSIPDNGFQPDGETDERISNVIQSRERKHQANTTPDRSSSSLQTRYTESVGTSDHSSNGTPTRRIDTMANSTYNSVAPQENDGASNPTPTRRNSYNAGEESVSNPNMSRRHYETNETLGMYDSHQSTGTAGNLVFSTNDSAYDDPSQPSNPTLTRRSNAMANSTYNSVAPQENDGASNPTPTRRNSYNAGEENISSPIISRRYYETDDSAYDASSGLPISTLTRRTDAMEKFTPNDVAFQENDRASNPTPTRR